jgi:hypothetical protein
MIGKLNFSEYNTVDVFLNSLRSREFDVRAASTTNLNGAREVEKAILAYKASLSRNTPRR